MDEVNFRIRVFGAQGVGKSRFIEAYKAFVREYAQKTGIPVCGRILESQNAVSTAAETEDQFFHSERSP